jgi:ketosteroid isomerase-like protein
MSQVVAGTGEGIQAGRAFAEALGRKDFDGVLALLAPRIDFAALTPRRSWEASDAVSVVRDVLRHWFKDTDEIDEIAAIEVDAFSDRSRVAYRFHGRNADGPFVLEQQAYYTERDGRIAWMRVLCSGYRPRA